MISWLVNSFLLGSLETKKDSQTKKIIKNMIQKTLHTYYPKSHNLVDESS